MKSTKVAADGSVRCPRCGAANSFTSKRTGKAKVFGLALFGVGALLAPKRLQCHGCGTYLRPAPRAIAAVKPAPLTAERGAQKCRHGVRRDICALCGHTEKVPGAK